MKLRVAFGTLFLAECMLRVACFCLDVSVLSALKLATSLPTMFTWHQGCVGKNGLKTSIYTLQKGRPEYTFCALGNSCTVSVRFPPVRTAKIGSFCMPNRVQTTQQVCFVAKCVATPACVWAGFRFSLFTGPWCLSQLLGTYKQSATSQGNVQWICHTVADKCKWKKPVLSRDLVCMWLYYRIWSENTGCFKGQGISSDLALCLFVTGSQVGPSIPLKPSFTEAWLQLPFLQIRFRCSSCNSLGRTPFGHCMDAKHCSNSQCYSSSMAWAPRTDRFGHHKNCNCVQSATTIKNIEQEPNKQSTGNVALSVVCRGNGVSRPIRSLRLPAPAARSPSPSPSLRRSLAELLGLSKQRPSCNLIPVSIVHRWCCNVALAHFNVHNMLLYIHMQYLMDGIPDIMRTMWYRVLLCDNWSTQLNISKYI